MVCKINTVRDVRCQQRHRGRPPRILVVDSAPEPIAASLSLETAEIWADLFSSGVAALPAARTGLYDLIVVGLHLPDMSGLDILARLRKENIATPAVMIASEPSYEAARLSGVLGATAFLVKPVDSAVLISAVRATVGSCPSIKVTLEAGFTNQSLESQVSRLCRQLELCEDPVPSDWPAPLLEVDGCPIAVWHLVDAVLRGMTRWETGLVTFGTVAQIFKGCVSASPGSAFADIGRSARGYLETPGRTQLSGSSTLAIRLVEEAVEMGKVLSRRTWLNALTPSMRRAGVSRLLQREIGYEFRQLRWIARVRHGCISVVSTKEQIGQIAVQLGYRDISQFDHHFRSLVHIEPTEFRRLHRRMTLLPTAQNSWGSPSSEQSSMPNGVALGLEPPWTR